MARIGGAISAGDNLSGFVRHRWAVALTEVLKIVAEDRASHVIDAVANRAQYQFGASAKSAERFAKQLSGYVVESVVSFGRIGIQSMVAFSAASVVALGAVTYKIIEGQIEYDRWVKKMGGGSTPLLSASDNLTASLDGAASALARAVSSATDLPGLLNQAATAADQFATITDRGFVTKFADILQNRVAPILGGMGPAGALAAGGINALGGLRAGAELAKGGDEGGPMRLGPFGINARSKDQQDKDAADAAKREQEWSNETIKAHRAAEEAVIAGMEERSKEREAEEQAQLQAEAEFAAHRARFAAAREERERSQYEERKKIYDAEKEQRRKDADDAKRAAEDQQRIAEQTSRMAMSVGASFGSLFKQIINGGMSAADVLLSILGTGIAIAGNVLAPGAGTAASAGLGFLGSLFNEGGVARAANGMRVPGVGAGDRVPALLERGEVVIPNGASHPSFIDEVARAAGGGGGHTTVNLSQGYLVPPDSVTAQRNYQRGLVPVLQDLHSTGRGSVTNPRFRGRKAS